MTDRPDIPDDCWVQCDGFIVVGSVRYNALPDDPKYAEAFRIASDHPDPAERAKALKVITDAIAEAEAEHEDDPDEIEITPEMLRAGIDEYALYEFADPGEWVVSAIYRAMRKAST